MTKVNFFFEISCELIIIFDEKEKDTYTDR